MNYEGCVENIVYRNPDNGYSVLELKCKGEKDAITCVGTFMYIAEGDYLRVEGMMTKHQMYGDQLRVTSYEAIEPEDSASMEMYLGSGAIKGVGKALAAKIIKYFGDDTFRVIEDEPERLADIKGISERMAREISSRFNENREERRSVMFLQQYGITANLAVKINKKYGAGMYEIIRTNPYRMADEIPGVGFKTVDEIAARAGLSGDNEYRIRAGILYALSEAAGAGHTYLPQDKLVKYAISLLNVTQDDLERQLDKLLLDSRLKCVVTEDGERCIYNIRYYFMELNVARMLLDLDCRYEVNRAAFDRKIGGEREDGEYGGTSGRNTGKRTGGGSLSLDIELDELQKEAVYEAAGNGVFVLTGGPGTGKTTTINAIIKFFESEGLDILLAAPTGRAAKRMSETTGKEASTIHRLLELKPTSDLTSEESSERNFHFERNDSNPLEADVVIIDEMSMVDISLMNALLKAVTVGTRLILVGDVNQLPSVGAGNVLKDIINSGAFHVVKLNRIFRQALTSDIVVNAHKINNGEQISLDNKSRDFFFMRRELADDIAGVVVALVRDKLPKYVNAKPYDIQVLTPMKKGELGVERLNSVLQYYLNPPEKGKAEKEHHSCIFREGDKVMQIKNNYQTEWEVRNKKGYLIDSGTGVFNGDCGIIRSINAFSESLEIEFDEGRVVEYPFSQLDELELAYAVTIHKSQGSEYPAVVLPLLNGPSMLFNRNLLYTAVTRAKNCVTIVGSSETVQGMIANLNEQQRYSGLARHIRNFNRDM